MTQHSAQCQKFEPNQQGHVWWIQSFSQSLGRLPTSKLPFMRLVFQLWRSFQYNYSDYFTQGDSDVLGKVLERTEEAAHMAPRVMPLLVISAPRSTRKFGWTDPFKILVFKDNSVEGEALSPPQSRQQFMQGGSGIGECPTCSGSIGFSTPMNQWWLDYQRICASVGLYELSIYIVIFILLPDGFDMKPLVSDCLIVTMMHARHELPNPTWVISTIRAA